MSGKSAHAAFPDAATHLRWVGVCTSEQVILRVSRLSSWQKGSGGTLLIDAASVVAAGEIKDLDFFGYNQTVSIRVFAKRISVRQETFSKFFLDTGSALQNTPQWNRLRIPRGRRITLLSMRRAFGRIA